MAFEAYSVAVKLSLINHVSSGLLMISKGLTAAGTDAETLNKRMASIGKQAMIGGVMFAGGLAIAHLFKAPLEEAKRFEAETQRFRSLGLGDVVTNDAVKFAKGMNSYGTSIRENLGLLRDAQTVFGDFHEAQMVAPLLAKMKFANAALYGDEGGAMKDRAFMDMLKVIEMRGGLASQEAFNKQANMVQQVQTATGGRVGANEFLNFIKTGGVAAKGMKDENFYYAMEPLIQEMGGQRVGTGLMSSYQNLVQGRTTERAAGELMRLGMLDPKKVEYNKVGNIKRILPGAVHGSDVMVADPLKWMQTVMLPAFASKGITDKQAVLNEIGAIFTNRTASQLYSTMYLQQAQIAKNYRLNAGAAGIEELTKNAQNSLSGKELAFGKKWNDLMLVLGNTILPLATAALDKLLPAITSLAGWIDKNHGAVKAFMVGLVGLSAFLIGGGLINMIIAAGRGFWLLSGALRFLAVGGFMNVLPLMARFGSYLVIFAVDFAKVMGSLLMASPFIRGLLMAFLSPIKLIGQGLYYFISPLTLLLGPVGLVIAGLAAAGLLLWNNWEEISKSLKSMWEGMKTGFSQLFHGDLLGSFKSFAYVWLKGWQTIFNTLIAGANAILPASMQVQKLHFADDYQRKNLEPQGVVAPVPIKASEGGSQILQVNLDGKKLGEVVIGQLAKQAAKPQTSPQGFDLLRSRVMPGTSSTAYPRG